MRSLFLPALWASSVAAQKVVSWDMQRRAAPIGAPKRSKRATITENLGNAEELYYANVTVGTPGQLLQLQLDTGSSDVWMTAASAEYCLESESGCIGGTYDPQQSSTYRLVDSGGFQIQYVDNTGSSGDYISDRIDIGGVTITGQQMGLALETTIGTGIIGVGFSADEAVCVQTQGACRTYPSIIDQMVDQSRINSHAYSLWLNDLESNTGSILFGGVDTDKYIGSLVTLPVLRDAQSGSFTSFSVAWTGFSIGTPNGEETNFVAQNFAYPAILDSGTSIALFPDDLANKLYVQFGAQYSNQLQAYVAPCYLRESNATLDFEFGGADGPIIRVPVAEFLLDLTSPGQPPLQFDNGDVACLLGFQGAQGDPILLGDTFLRSAYVVYDITNREISIAQTMLNANSQNVQEIQSGNNGVPNVASTASAASLVATATAGHPSVAAGATGGGDDDSGAAATLSPTGPPPLAAFTTAPASAATQSQGAAAAVTAPTMGFGGFTLIGLVSVLATLGATFVWV